MKLARNSAEQNWAEKNVIRGARTAFIEAESAIRPSVDCLYREGVQTTFNEEHGMAGETVDIHITDVRQDTDDLSGKTTECVALRIGDEPECVVASSKLLTLIRFTRRRLDRSTSGTAQGRKGAKSGE